jgi:hypothetical protein
MATELAINSISCTWKLVGTGGSEVTSTITTSSIYHRLTVLMPSFISITLTVTVASSYMFRRSRYNATSDQNTQICLGSSFRERSHSRIKISLLFVGYESLLLDRLWYSFVFMETRNIAIAAALDSAFYWLDTALLQIDDLSIAISRIFDFRKEVG